MYLKSIRAQGFKSFADKIDLEINPGITGIVGPNGSGKSNIVDAVRWVLGEQSVKSLRSSMMSDVIFNGSASREALKRAYVALVFDNSDHYLNSDFKEIEVKRVVYQTGENEYYLNNTRVRLKDITDLFIESGAGAGAFNIISQGNVTDIVNSKSTDRRVIFEAAARVLKYKRRKEESIRKLEKTEENLLRLNLVIEELKTTIKPLEKQSKKAEQYLTIKKELESMDIALICQDITKLNEDYQTLQKEIEVLKTSIENKQDHTLEVSLEKMKTQNLTLEDKLNTSREKLLELTKKLSNLNNEKQLTIERQKYSVDKTKLDENLINLKTEILNLEKEKELQIEALKRNESALNTNKEKGEEVSNELLKLKVKRNACQTSLVNKNQELFIYQNKIEVLENNILNDASSPASVKSVLNNPRLKGIHSSLGKLISVEDKYLVALDTALGTSKNNIVTDDEEAAIEAINYLKSQKIGRATFLPLNIIKGRFVNSETLDAIKNIKGYLGTMLDYVKYDSIYHDVVANALGNVLLVTDAKCLTNVGKLTGHKLKIVSLEGELASVGGAITGGLSKSSNLIYEKNELQKLKQGVNTINIDITSLNNDLKDVQKQILSLEEQEQNLLKEAIVLEEEVNNKNKVLNGINENLKLKQNELEGLSNLKEDKVNDKIMVLLEEINILEKDKELLEIEIDDYTSEKNNHQEEINILEKQIRDNNTLINNKLNDLKNKEVLLGKTEVKLDNLLVSLNNDYNLTYEYASVNYSLEIDAFVAQERVANLKKELAKLGEVNTGSIAEFERLNTRFQFLTTQRDDLEKSSSELKDIITEMDEVMKEKFQTTFGEIRTEFKRIFKLMFKGGEGELKLSDPDDLLNTGIDIIAIPPGKKIASPMSLSGGEKALTAICLLFAILEVHPSPFIILDEAEAALDEANVDMFGKYLNAEKDKSQFIVITHKKRMMEYADILYGITMQESGVSKIVSTKLEN